MKNVNYLQLALSRYSVDDAQKSHMTYFVARTRGILHACNWLDTDGWDVCVSMDTTSHMFTIQIYTKQGEYLII